MRAHAVCAGAMLLLFATCEGDSGVQQGTIDGAPAGTMDAGSTADATAGSPDVADGSPPVPGPSCAAFTPCGGTLVGTWTIQDSCAAADDLTIDSCPQAIWSYEEFTARGTVTFNADLTMTTSVTTHGKLKVTLPPTCISNTSCASVEHDFRTGLMKDASSSYSSITCSGDSSCDCTFVYDEKPDPSVEAYAVSGTVVTEGQDRNDYCVSGSELRITTHDMAGDKNAVFSMLLAK